MRTRSLHKSALDFLYRISQPAPCSRYTHTYQHHSRQMSPFFRSIPRQGRPHGAGIATEYFGDLCVVRDLFCLGSDTDEMVSSRA